MKNMVYKATREREILDEGICAGINYWIISYGTHPCAYVQVPKNNRNFGKFYNDIDIDVHRRIYFFG